MHAVLRRYQVPLANREEVIRRVDEVWVDQARKLPGFVSYYVLDDGKGKLMSFSVFLTEEQAEHARDISAAWSGSHLMDLDVDLEDTHTGAVAVHAGEV